MIGLVLNPSLDHKANNANKAIIMLQGTADVDPTLSDFLYCLIKRDIKRLSFCQTLHPKGDPRTEAGMESRCVGVKASLRR